MESSLGFLISTEQTSGNRIETQWCFFYMCVCEIRYNKRSVVRLVILAFAGGPWAHGWHGPTKTHP